METMTVIAPKGATCPMEMSRSLINDAKPEVVPNNNYYRARVAEGSLVDLGAPFDKAQGANITNAKNDTSASLSDQNNGNDGRKKTHIKK